MFRILILLFLALCLASPQPARAGWCEDLWFTRNAILDRAGICFGTPLAQATFSNADCVGTSVELAPEFVQLVNFINDIEARNGCRVDTSRTVLDLRDLSVRRQLVMLPIPSEYGDGFGCIGWKGAAVSLWDMNSEQGRVIGKIEPGDTVYFSHILADGWSYVTTEPPGRVGLKSGGWMAGDIDARTMCAEQAG